MGKQDIEFVIKVDTSRLREAMARFQEALSLAAKRRALKKVEARLEKSLKTAFRKQGKAFIKAFAGLASKFEESRRLAEDIGESDWGPLFDDVAATTLTLFIKPIEQAAKNGLKAGAKAMIGELGLSIKFGLQNPRAVAYLEEYGAARVTKINETTRDYIRTVVTSGVRDGWTHQQIADAITERFEQFAVGKPQEHINSRAHLIAVTEAGEAYEEGSLIVARDLQDAGVDIVHWWNTMNDDRVSEGCQENAEAGKIPLDEAFPSGHMRPLRFPGCRCSGGYGRKAE